MGFVLVMTKEVDLQTALRHTPRWLSICFSLTRRGLFLLLPPPPHPPHPSSQSPLQGKNFRLRGSEQEDFSCLFFKTWHQASPHQMTLIWAPPRFPSLRCRAVTMRRGNRECCLVPSIRADGLHASPRTCIWLENLREMQTKSKIF